MTAPTTAVEPNHIPTPHPAWCQPNLCHGAPGAGATHVHRIGRVADVTVSVERDDNPTADGGIEIGVPLMRVHGFGVEGLTDGHADDLAGLLHMAKVMASYAREVR